MDRTSVPVLSSVAVYDLSEKYGTQPLLICTVTGTYTIQVLPVLVVLKIKKYVAKCVPVPRFQILTLHLEELYYCHGTI